MTNAVLDALKTRRSIRKFKTEQIKEEELDAVLEAGTYAPNGRGAQASVIVAVQNPNIIQQLAQMNAKVMGAEGNPYYGAPAIIVVLADKKRNTYIEDGSCVLDNMMTAAHSLGLGSCWIHREKQMFDSPEGKALKQSWGLSEDHEGIGALAIGYPDGEIPAAAPRKENYVIKIK